jgi:hypothetical protein
LNELVEEAAAVGDPASFGEIFGVLLKLRDLRLFGRPKAVVVEGVLLQSTTHLLVGAAAHAKHGKISRHLVVVAQIFVRVEIFYVLFDGIFLVEPSAQGQQKRLGPLFREESVSTL